MVAEADDRVGHRAKSRHISLTLIRNLAQITDPIVIATVGIVASIIYIVLIVGADITSSIIVTVVIGAIGTSICCHWFNLYSDRFLFSTEVPFDRLTAAWAIVFATLLFTAFALKISSDFSRVWAISWFVGGVFALVGTRFLMRAWVYQQVRSGTLVERTVIFGAGDQGLRFAAQINKHADPFTHVMGFIDDRTTRVPRSSQGYELLGNTRTLVDLIRANKIDQVFLALPTSANKRLTEIMQQLANTPVRVCLVLDSLGFEAPNKTIRYIEKSPILQIFDHPLSGWSYVIKQIEDKTIAALILLFISPLLMCIAVAIKLDSPGPVLFKQRRYGFNNNPIEVWKFRTMHADCGEASGIFSQTKRGDPRVTRVGRFLRKSSLDELPQFFNVLTGHMSIVGPRPHAVGHLYENRDLAEIVDRYAARHRVKPGITGWAQVNGWRGETDTVVKLQKRIEYDLYYIDNWSVWLDLLIMWRTLFLILRDKNAY